MKIKLFRTGDLGKWNKYREVIIHLGRIDFQVKIRGVRIELFEIENVIKTIKEIKNSIVIDKVKPNGDKYLVGYYISDEEIKSDKIRNYLKDKLPVYMIPNYYIKIDKIPYNNRGKLDRNALPEPIIEDIIKENYESPKREIEKIVCGIYSNVFKIPENEIGRAHDFYELGGDSLNAIRISSGIEKILNVKISIKDIIGHPVISELSKFIELKINNSCTNDRDNNDNTEIIVKRNSKEFPVTSQQLGIYIGTIKDQNSTIYNIPTFFKLNRNVNVEKLKKSILRIFSKQEILRSKYYGKEINGKMEIYGFIDDECSLKFEEYSYENFGRFVRPFDLSKAPLIRVGFIKDEVLLIDMHHIICDGSTMMIIMDELNKYYNDEEVEELEIQYSDYAAHLNEKKKNGELNEQIEVYREIFSNEYEILNIPTKNNINNNEYNGKEENINEESNQSNKIEQIIDKSTSEMINEFIKQHNISKTALFISIYGYVLSKYSEQDVVYTSMMSANRNNQYVENMAGMFVSTLPLLLKYTNEENRFIETIKENMELLVNIYNHQDISFAELAEILKLKKVNNSFIFQPKISKEKFILQNSSIFYIDDENKKRNINSLFRMENLIKQENESKFDISFNILENKEDYLISIEYNTKLYDSLMIKNIIDSYIEVVRNINNLENSDIRNIEYIPMEQKERIIKEFNSDVNKEGCEKLYHEEFQKMAKQYPERIAIVFNEEKITYKELDEMSNSLAHYLRSEGVCRNDIIPVISDRSPYYIIGILGISKAGGAFLPIDKDLPDERIQFILGEVNSKVILFSNCKDVIDKLRNNEDNIKYNMYDLVKHDYSNN
eukprot:jgi/Orpsp1_1/1181662/evm.model.c7180000078104.1